MLEIRDHVVEQLNNLGLVPGAARADLGDALQEMLQARFVENRLIFDHADGVEALHVERFGLSIELLEVFLAGGVAGKEVHGPLLVGDELGGAVAGFVFGGALVGFEAQGLQVAHGDVAEAHQVQLLAEFGEEDVAVGAQQAGHQAQLAGLLGGDEVAAHVVGGRDGLAFGEALVEAVQQGAVGKGHVGKAGGGDGQGQALAHQEHLHDALAGPHHVHRVRGLVGGDAEVLAGAGVARLGDGGQGIEDVHLNQAHQGEGILLAAHVLERGQVEDVVVAPAGVDQRLVFPGAAVEGEGAEVTVDVAQGAADIAHQLDHVVLADVHHVQHFGVAPEDFARDGLADGAGATDHQEPGLLANQSGHLGLVPGLTSALEQRPNPAQSSASMFMY